MTVYTVMTTADSGEGSLRDAINQVNNDDGPDVIQFQIGQGSSAQTILTLSPLPAIQTTVTIDGTTQPGYVDTPVIIIDGKNSGRTTAPGLLIQADDSVVKGLSVVDSTGAGISIDDADGVQLLSDDIGIVRGVGNVKPRVAPNAGNGVSIDFSTGDVIGQPGEGNVIGGNSGDGIFVTTTASNVSIQGDSIGFLPIPDSQIGLGPQNYGNVGDGINLTGSTANTVGGPATGAGNLISGNSGSGVHIVGGSGNLLLGNKIGTSFNGERAVPNGIDGIRVEASPSNTIGGPASGAGNLISGNVARGITIDQPTSTGNLIQGNSIGFDLAGTTAIPNASDGIYLLNSPGNMIGGFTPGAANYIANNGGNGVNIQKTGSPGTVVAGNQILSNSGEGILAYETPSNSFLLNIIAGNRLNGIAVMGPSASGNLVQGNIIGINPVGEQSANLQDGILILNSSANTIGGLSASLGNTISDNAGDGVALLGPGSSNNLIVGNDIGTDPSSTPFRGNLLDGIAITNASGNTIGGTVAGARNVISRNRNGIDIQTISDAQAGPTAADLHGGLADGNLVQGNFIGTDILGESPLGNSQDGIVITNGSNNTIGGTVAGARNVVANSLADGIGIGMNGSGIDPTIGDVIQGNIIGLDATGTRQLGNAQDGIHLALAIDAIIGGTSSGAGNVISGNTNGVDIAGSLGLSLNDIVQGNVIGLGIDGEQLDPTAAGLPSLSNTGNGIILEQGASAVTIGGTTFGTGNVISGNGSAGIRFLTFSSGDLVEGNRIGVALDGLTPRPNNESGLFIAERSSMITIGGTTFGTGNVISGNSVGVTITNPGTSNNLVEGNIIGLGLDGLTAEGNLGFGVLLINGVTGNTIGGTSGIGRNVISSNGQGVGIVGTGSTGNVVEGDVIGLDASGSIARGNIQLGIYLNSASGNIVGGTSPGAGNVISGNTGVGVEVFGAGSSNNLLAGNIIGLDATGSTSVGLDGQSLGNAGFGVQVREAPNDSIGGTATGEGNVISGNRQAGVDVSGLGSGGTFVLGNLIGTDASGRVALGNQADGVLVENAPVVYIGGYGASAGNVISGNAGSGVDVTGQGSNFDQVQGNLIGLDLSGSVVMGNGQSGIYVNSAPGVTIGGTVAGYRNFISGNGEDGVRIAGSNSGGSLVVGNFIGLDATGTIALGNKNDGVLFDGTVGVTVGGTSTGSANVISGNVASGVEFGGLATSGDILDGNLIGLDASGRFGLGNSTGVLVSGSPYNQIGGIAAGAGNVISGNATAGVHLVGPGAFNDAIVGNLIGTDLTGSIAVANQAGVFLDGAPSDLISGNVLSGNTVAGAIIQGTGASGNILQGNLVGLDATGTRAIVPSGTPQQTGVLVIDAPRNVVGDSSGNSRNIVSGNVVGVDISGFNAQANLIIGNFLGTNATGTSAIPNQSGIYLNGSPSNTVGGTTSGSANLISGNSATGVDLYGSLTTGNLIEGNKIGTNFSGTAAVPNATGVFVDIASSNTIGGPTSAAGNLISGNSVAGVYMFEGASGNLVQDNRIGVNSAGRALGNGQYGILLFNAANNTIDKSKATGNLIANSGIGNFREFTGAVSTTTTTTTTTKKTTKAKPKPKVKTVVKAAHPAGPKVSSKAISPQGSAGGSASSHQTGR